MNDFAASETSPSTAAAGRAAVLLGPGGHNVRANRRLRAVAARVAARAAPAPVVAAYLQAGKDGAVPSLGEAVDSLAPAGVTEIAVVPFLLEWGYPEHLDVPDLLRDLAAAHPQLRLRLGRTLGSAPEVLEAVAGRLAEAWALPEVDGLPPRTMAEIADQTPVTTARLPDGTFPSLPAQAQHLLLCASRRCSELGSAATFRALTLELAERGLDAGPGRVKVTRTKCLGPCAAAPVGCLYPAGSYVARLDRATVPAFVEHVLVGGGRLPGHTFDPAPAGALPADVVPQARRQPGSAGDPGV